MKAIGYIRVSTEGQAEKGISLEAQRAKIEAYAVTKDLELVEIIEDVGLSAKNLKRPGVRRVLDMARRKEVDAVVIVKLDRMFRNTVDALETAQAFDRRGVGLHSISESLDTQSAMGKFFFTLTAALAEMERGIVGERTKAALAQKRRKGEATGGHTLYGFDRDGERLVPNSDEQDTLRHIESLRLQGKSFQAIADALNMDGIPTKQGNPWSRVRGIQDIAEHCNRRMIRGGTMPDLTKVTSTNLVSYTELLSFEGALSLASAIGEVGEGLINNIDDGLNEDDANRTRGAIVLVTYAARSLACFFQQVHVENLNKTWGHHE